MQPLKHTFQIGNFSESYLIVNCARIWGYFFSYQTLVLELVLTRSRVTLKASTISLRHHFSLTLGNTTYRIGTFSDHIPSAPTISPCPLCLAAQQQQLLQAQAHAQSMHPFRGWKQLSAFGAPILFSWFKECEVFKSVLHFDIISFSITLKKKMR